MFDEAIEKTALTGITADGFFTNIRANDFKYDVSFVSTLRALFPQRIGNNDNIFTVDTFDFTRTKNDMGETNSKEFIRNVIAYYTYVNGVSIINVKGNTEAVTELLTTVKNDFLQYTEGFKELKDLSAFVAKQTEAYFYINEGIKASVVFVRNLNLKTWHLLQSLISRICPWWFKDKPLNDEEKELLKSLTYADSSEYKRLIALFAQKYDFRSEKIKKLLGGFESRCKQKKLDEIRDSINNYKSYIDDNIKSYRALIEELEGLKLKESGLIYQINEGSDDSEIVDYFLCNKHVNLISANDNCIEIIVDTTLDNYDPEIYEVIRSNPKSYLYCGYSQEIEIFKDSNIRKKFLDACFGDEPVLKIKIRAYYKLWLEGVVSTLQRYRFPSEYNDYLSNPHLDFYACIGNNKPIIESYLREGEYITAIEQCVSSAKNINLAEGAQTVAPFLEILFSTDRAVIQLPDSSSCSPEEAYKWLTNNNNGVEE